MSANRARRNALRIGKLALLLGLPVLLVVAYLVWTHRTVEGTALALGDGDSEVSLAVDVNESVTYGINVIRSTAEDDVTLLRAELISSKLLRGVEVIETRTLPVSQYVHTVGIARGYPPTKLKIPWDQTAAVKGTVLRARENEEVALLFGVRVTRPGVWLFEQVRVTYQMAGRTYEQQVTNALQLCAPSSVHCS